MSIHKIYFDACIFVGYIHKKHKNNKRITECLENMETLVMEVCSSEWALGEACKVLVRDYGYQKSKALEEINKLRKNNQINNLKIKWIEIDPNKGYEFKEFFKHLTNELMETKDLHIADAIHSLIMSNNDIEYILTTDDDFNVVKRIYVIKPEFFKLTTQKNN